ncbi:MAG: M48 family metalloprotease [Hyphomicrobiaceae bacterium]
MRPASGLFGHIQRNNAKSIAMVVLFLLLLEAMQIGIRLIPYATTANRSTRFNDVEVSLRRREPAPSIVNKMAPGTGHARNSRHARPRPTVRHPSLFDRINLAWSRFVANTTFFERDWYLILLVGIVYLVSSCWWSSIIMRYETRARSLARTDAPDLYNLVENLAIAIGLPTPKIEVIESPKLNAYASGFFPKSSSIALTRGIIEKLNRDELEAVIAHELVHIRDRDVRLLVVARACVDMVLPMGRSLVANAREKPVVMGAIALFLAFQLGLTFALGFALLFTLVACLALAFRFAISRTREFTADAGAIELTKNPVALISALRKVSGDDVLPLTSYATRAMMFSCTLEGIFKTHPPVDERVAAIVAFAAVQPFELPVVRPHSQQTEPLTELSQPAFGRRRNVHGLPSGVAFPGSVLPQSGKATAAPPWSTAQAKAQTPFGRRAVGLDPSQPGSIVLPASDVLASRPEPVRTEPQTFGEYWIASGRIDRMVSGAAKAVTMPIQAMIYISVFSACASVGLMLVIITVTYPLIGIPLLVGLVYGLRWLAGRFAAWSTSNLGSLLRRFTSP